MSLRLPSSLRDKLSVLKRSRRPRRVAGARPLTLEALENRLMPDVGLASVLTAFNNGARDVVQTYGPALVRRAWDADLPLVNEAVDAALGLADKLGAAFDVRVDPAAHTTL